MKKFKKILAMVLSLSIMLNNAPISVFAEDVAAEEPVVEETQGEEQVIEEEEASSETDFIIEEESVEDAIVEDTIVEEESEEVVESEETPVKQQDFSDVQEENPVEEQEEEPVEEKTESAKIVQFSLTKTANNEEETEVESLDDAIMEVDATAATFDEFVRAFALDCGRLYFSVDQIKEIIDEMAKYDYTHLTLAFGNSGFRFLLDDMTIGSYESEDVKNAILEGNTFYTNNDGHNAVGSNSSNPVNTCLTEAEMDEIIAYANEKGIAIIPALNSPGHMNTIVYAMGELGISNAGYPVSSSYNSESTINIDNIEVTNFVSALIQKYINYYKEKGCTMFNLGADEFANDPTDDVELGFTETMKTGFINYVNTVATSISEAGMIPMMFNDGYAWSDASFNKDIVVCYWTSGAVSSTDIANAGHNVINNSQRYYYVLGEPFGTAANSWCSYASATNGVNNVPVTTLVDDGNAGEKLVGVQMFLWCDYTDEVYDETEETKVKTLIRTLAENNPNYFEIPTEPEVRDITVSVNQTVADTISGHVYTDYDIADTSKVSVELVLPDGDIIEETTVSTTPATELEDGATYIIRVFNTNYALSSNSGRGDWGTSTLAFESNSLTSNTNHLWTLEASGSGYKLKNAAGYLNLGESNNTAYLNSTGEVFTITYTSTGWTIGNENGRYINALGGLYSYYSAGGWTGDGTRFDLYKVTTATEASTRAEFTGVAVGVTTVTVGHVTYNVNVVAEDVSKVSLTWHSWLSNYSVHPEGTGANNCNSQLGVAYEHVLSASKEGVNSEEGINFSTLVDSTGDWRWEEGAQTVYWKSTVLPYESRQEGNGTTDSSMSGTDFTYIRYWDGMWSYSSDRQSWTEIEDSDEVCAYYLQETEVTAEVETFVKDWAYTSSTAAGTGEGRYQKALSFAVVYEDGTLNPSEDLIYAKSTLIYWDNLEHLGFLRVGVNEVYNVKKITYTFGERETTSQTTNWQDNDTIVWNKTMIDGKAWYDETVCWDESYETEPVVNGQNLISKIYAGEATESVNGNATNYNGTWGANDAVLILIYIEPVVTEDSLYVIYYDEKFNDTLYSYTVSVNSGENFNDNIVEVSTETIKDPGVFAGNAERIDVNGYGIRNIKGVVRAFQTDLTQIPDAIGKYNSSLYSYTGSEISEDGKTLYLYYNINTQALSPNLVADFGVPLMFELNDIVGENQESVVKEVTVNKQTKYGTLSYDEEEKLFIYTPTTILQGIDVLSINILFDGESSVTTTNVGVTPATTVHYEESFINWDSKWDVSEPDLTLVQRTEVLGGKIHNYGFDPMYEKTSGASNGTNASADEIGAKGTFTFTGNGIQIFANSTESTGYVTVQVTNSSGAIVNYSMVDTIVAEGTTSATAGQTGSLYGLPVVSLIDLQNIPHDTYTVTIRKVMDSKPVYIDGIRVFNTIKDTSNFIDDLEDNPNFYELRDMVLYAIGTANNKNVEEYSEDYKTMINQVYDATKGATAIITDETVDYADSETVQDLLDNGPKNELYLYANQTLTFKVSTKRVMQIGLKVPNGSTEAIVQVLNGTETLQDQTMDLNSSVDMFYSLVGKAANETTYTIKITNNGTNILSVTLLKICDDPNAAFVELTAEDIESILFVNKEVETPDVVDPEVGTPEVETPEVEVPDVVEPEVNTPEINNPEVDTNGSEVTNPEAPEGGVANEGNNSIDSDETVEPDNAEVKEELTPDTETTEDVETVTPSETEELPEAEVSTGIIARIIQAILGFFASLAKWFAGLF